MTSRNRINRVEVLGEFSQRDDDLMLRLNLTESDLQFIRSNRFLYDRIMSGARTLVQRLRSADVSPTKISASITLDNLALMVDDGSYTTSPPTRAVDSALARRYGATRRFLEISAGLNPPNTQFVREAVGAYDGNLYAAKWEWPSLEASRYDWARSVRIPLRVGFEECKLVGIVEGKGKILPYGKDKKRDSKLSIGARDFDVEFHEQVVLPLFQEHINLTVTPTPNTQYTRDDEQYYSRGQVSHLEINSLAFVSWIKYSLGMGVEKGTSPGLFESFEQQLGLLVGVLASRGLIYSYPNKTMLRVDGPNTLFLRRLERISKIYGFSPNLTPDGRYLRFPKADILTMRDYNLLINPHHVRQANALPGLYQPSRPR